MPPRLRIAGLLSLTLHLLIAAAILLHGNRGVPLSEAPDKPVAVELVLEEQQGAGQTTPQSAPQTAPQTAVSPPPPPNPAGPVDPAKPQLPPPDRTALAEALPAPAPAPENPTAPAPENPTAPAPENPTAPAPENPRSRPPQPVPAPTPTTLAFNLGGTDSESNALVTGDNIIPASPDKKARNRPPLYPDEAVRRGQQGAVIVVIHVSPAGLATGADVVSSSGVPALDRAARDAVLAWRYLPAVKDGAPIPFDTTMRFVFSFQ